VLVAIHGFEPALKGRGDLAILDFDAAMFAHKGAQVSQGLSQVGRGKQTASPLLLLPGLTACEEECKPG
jgi:hypothetical protein